MSATDCIDAGHAKPCHAHGTPGCTLIAHRSPAGQRIDWQPRCVRCGRVMSLTRHPDHQPCDRCADELLIGPVPQSPTHPEEPR